MEPPESQYALTIPGTETPVPKTLVGGKYRIDKVLGSGGMGAVYRGIQVDTELAVAIKLLNPNLVQNKEVVSRFWQEAKAPNRILTPRPILPLMSIPGMSKLTVGGPPSPSWSWPIMPKLPSHPFWKS